MLSAGLVRVQWSALLVCMSHAVERRTRVLLNADVPCVSHASPTSLDTLSCGSEQPTNAYAIKLLEATSQHCRATCAKTRCFAVAMVMLQLSAVRQQPTQLPSEHCSLGKPTRIMTYSVRSFPSSEARPVRSERSQRRGHYGLLTSCPGR